MITELRGIKNQLKKKVETNHQLQQLALKCGSKTTERGFENNNIIFFIGSLSLVAKSSSNK